MSSPPPHSIFDFPEIVGFIAQHLSRHDLLQCIATSKAFSVQFEPFLWRDMDLTKLHSVPQSVSRNRHRICSITIPHGDYTDVRMPAAIHTFMKGIPDLVPPDDLHFTIDRRSSLDTFSPHNSSPIFPQLRSVYIDEDWMPKDEEEDEEYWGEPDTTALVRDVLRILSQSPKLTHLTLSAFLDQEKKDNIKFVQHFLSILAHKLPHLQHLILSCSSMTSDSACEIMRVCFNHPQLAHLHCSFSVMDQDPIQSFRSFLADLKDDKDNGTLGRPAMGSRIKSLILPYTYAGYPVDLICALLKFHLPSLERFHIPPLVSNPQVSILELFRDALAQGCPRLQHIDVVCNERTVNIQNAAKGMVMASKELGLKSFHAIGLHDRTKDDNVYRGVMNDARSLVTLLQELHSSTLEEVELTGYRTIHPYDLMNIFYKCSNLKRAKIIPLDMDDAPFLEYLVMKEWACSDLRELWLFILRTDKLNQKHSHYESEAPRLDGLTKKVYGQIGRLSKLENLWLHYQEHGHRHQIEHLCGAKDLTLDRGWLSELAGLKRLKHLTIPLALCESIGQAEVEFMDSQWPRLEKVSIVLDHNSLWDVTKKPQWKWLKKRRPYLEFCGTVMTV
ncbi:hypothetical protein B0O80DRAFT_454982 [Mortierella sp. GBAus27b]|nr:hypothetical protein BGX31_004052 [Mortierella sp. GBA43]KAI8351912.1 hypothetical protein B0O80DRAFT_454982 [Mortierella sp. GBAus27b]